MHFSFFIIIVLITPTHQMENVINHKGKIDLRSKDPELAVDFPIFPNITSGEKRNVYYYGHAYLIKDVSSSGSLKHCEMVEV